MMTRRVEKVKENPGKESCPLNAKPLKPQVPILVRALGQMCAALQGVTVLLLRAMTLAAERALVLGAQNMDPDVKGRMAVRPLQVAEGRQPNVS